MTLFGKSLSEYVSFAWILVALVLLVGILRLVLSLAGAPSSGVKWLSVTAMAWIGSLYAAVWVHRSGFGSYKQLLPVIVLQSAAAQAIAIVAIAIAIMTGTDNIYTAPEYGVGGEGKSWIHAGAHLVIGTTVGSLVLWLVGSLVMFATKRLQGREKAAVAARA